MDLLAKLQGIADRHQRMMSMGVNAIGITNDRILSPTRAMIEGRETIASHGFSLADILLYCFLDFGAQVKQPIDPACTNIVAHHARMAARPSAQA